jgi:hypothetical protein
MVGGRARGPENRPPFTWQDVRGGTRRRADELTCTESEAAALKALRTATEPFQVSALLDAGALLESEHRGLTWDDVHAIRASSASNVALARRYHGPIAAHLCTETRDLSRGRPISRGVAGHAVPAAPAHLARRPCRSGTQLDHFARFRFAECSSWRRVNPGVLSEYPQGVC